MAVVGEFGEVVNNIHSISRHVVPLAVVLTNLSHRCRLDVGLDAAVFISEHTVTIRIQLMVGRDR